MINGRYKIVQKAGEGRSTVYLCEDRLEKNSRVAIKILPPSVSEEEKKAFRDEYFLLQRLNHPNIISVFDYGAVAALDDEDKSFHISTGSPFFTLEYFEGVELYESKSLGQENLLTDIVCQISSVLYYLHQSSYIYYDLKSENILIQERDNRPVIKFIDFGLTTGTNNIDIVSARGTSEYIAPEILRKEKIDHRIDLYSFGVLLYKILYGKFPFSVQDQLGIYKAHLNEQFEFPKSSFSDKLVELVKVLLSKDPDERFNTSIGIINAIAPEKLGDLRKDWTRVQTFAARNDAFSIISTYIEQENGGEVLAIKGAEGAGKSRLLQELNYKYPLSFILSPDQRTDGNLWQLLLRKILYQENIYPGIDQETRNLIKRLLDEKSVNLAEELKAAVIKLLSTGRFILLIDNFNLISDFDLDIFAQIIPILQVNKIKVVLTEDASAEYKSKIINSLQVINLNPFTETEVTEFVQNSFAEFYPSEEIKKAVLLYSDLLPGSIEIFLKDLIVLDILKFTQDGPSLQIDKETDKILKGSHEDIYKFRIENLDSDSRELAILLSLFNINPDIRTISLLINRKEQDITRSLLKLSEANIIHFNPVVGFIQFTSRGIKEFIYSTIEDLKEAHLTTAQLISGRIPDFNKNELAYHWEKAGEYELAYDTVKQEISRAGKSSALAYERSLLEHLSSLPLQKESLKEVKIELSNCLFQIGEHQASLQLINELLYDRLSSDEEILLKILKGKALIANQNLEEGKKLLESILVRMKSSERKNEILAEITEAEFEMARYDEADKLADKLIDDKNTLTETKGKIYRIKGLIELFKNNQPSKTIDFFENSLQFYQNARKIAKVAIMENNLGNIFNIILEKEKAEYHWKRSISLNESIGNLLQNGINLNSSGIYNFENCNYEKAVEQYSSAHSIFKTLGDINNLGINFINMGEVYLILCEFEKAMDVLIKASEIFKELDNKVEQAEAEYLLGKLYYSLGDENNFYRVIQKYSEFSLTLEKAEFNYDYLKVLYDQLNGKSSDIAERLFVLRDKSQTYSDSFLYCELQVKIIEQLMDSKQFEKAKKELAVENFIQICEGHTYYSAYKNYLAGKAALLSKDENEMPFMDYYTKALDLINEVSITELTWKILFDLYMVYSERGIVSRTNEFRNYAMQTIYYIADQFKSEKLKNIFLGKPERQYALNILERN